jgi:hypothetical protein
MRTNWKFPAYFGGLVLALVATAVSCSDESTAPQRMSAKGESVPVQQKTQNPQDKYDWPGKYHTDALAYVYSKLARANRASSKPEKCRIAIGALKEFNKSFSKDGKSTGIADDFLSVDPCTQIDVAGGVPSLTPALNPAGTGLSPKAISMVQQIMSVISSNPSAGAVVSAVTGIENDARSSLSAAEAGAIISMGSVARSSAQYWSANSAKWRELSSNKGMAFNQLSIGSTAFFPNVATPPNTPQYTLGSDCCRIGAADVSAFISSLITGWWMGSFDLELSAVRATIASIIAALQLLK